MENFKNHSTTQLRIRTEMMIIPSVDYQEESPIKISNEMRRSKTRFVVTQILHCAEISFILERDVANNTFLFIISSYIFLVLCLIEEVSSLSFILKFYSDQNIFQLLVASSPPPLQIHTYFLHFCFVRDKLNIIA